MEVWLLRHANASWDLGTPDAERSLDPHGERQAQAMGAWMAAQSFTPDHVTTSPARRARQTTMHLPGAAQAVVDDRIYEAGTKDLLQVLTDLPPETRSALLVGHNPGLEALARLLDPTVPDLAVSPCTLVRLDVDQLEAGSGRILDVRHARDLMA